jgi:hypothetical protein
MVKTNFVWSLCLLLSASCIREPAVTTEHQPEEATAVAVDDAEKAAVPTLEAPEDSRLADPAEASAAAKPEGDKGIGAVYRWLRIADIRVLGEAHVVGDHITIQYLLKNTSDSTLSVPRREWGAATVPAVGIFQHWLERLGEDREIAAIPARTAKRNGKYAAGGTVVDAPSIIGPGESLSFEQRIYTKDYPASRYAYIIEFRTLENELLHSEQAEFVLRDPASEPEIR